MSMFTTIGSLVAAWTLALTPAQAPTTTVPHAELPDDPTNRIEGNNPTIAHKVLGLDAWIDREGAQPDVLILGSSRTVMLDPEQVEQRTGRTAYNAAISSGAARELLAMTSFADLRSQGELPQLLVMLDLEAFDNRRPTTRVVDYLERLDAAHRACPDLPRCRSSWTRAAGAIVADAIARQRTGDRPYQETQRPDGRQINGVLERMDAAGADLDALRRERIGIRLHSYRRGGFDRIYEAPQQAFERMLQLANDRGVTPFVAITAMHPDCIRQCGPAGWTARHEEVRALLDQLGERYDFELVDLSLPSTWGGSGADFFDEIHLRPAGAAKVVRHLEELGAFETDR